MSEQITLILIYHQDLIGLQEWILKKKKKAYLLQANEDWSCLCVENDLKVSEKLAGIASMELQKVVLFFGDYDEYGWRCDFWESGTRKIHISVPFEMAEKIKIELPNPDIWLPYAYSTEVLENLNTLLFSGSLDPTGSELFKASFGIEHLSNMSFESLSSCSDDFLKEQGILMVKVNRKSKMKMKLLQIVLEILQKPLEEKGYFFVSQSNRGEYYDQYVFSKQIGSYSYFFRLEKIENQNALELSYYPPYYLRSVEEWMIENQLRPKITYSNELQLRTKLHELLIDILNIWYPLVRATSNRRS